MPIDGSDAFYTKNSTNFQHQCNDSGLAMRCDMALSIVRVLTMSKRFIVNVCAICMCINCVSCGLTCVWASFFLLQRSVILISVFLHHLNFIKNIPIAIELSISCVCL